MSAPRIPRRGTYIPAGADQQGRLSRTGCFIQAAEAANDVGCEEDSPDFRRQARDALVRYLVLCVLVVGATALVIYGGQP